MSVRHLDHPADEFCPVCKADAVAKKDLFSLFIREQGLLRETDTHVHTRPEGIEPGKLEIVWRKR